VSDHPKLEIPPPPPSFRFTDMSAGVSLENGFTHKLMSLSQVQAMLAGKLRDLSFGQANLGLPPLHEETHKGPEIVKGFTDRSSNAGTAVFPLTTDTRTPWSIVFKKPRYKPSPPRTCPTAVLPSTPFPSFC